MNSPVAIWRNQKKIRDNLNKTGEIISYTKIHVAPPEYESYVPYYVALVRLDSGDLTYGQLIDMTDDEVKIGVKVTAVLRRIRNVAAEEVLEYGVKFTIK
jgi:uncharacterized OB-fold protein